MKTKVDNISYMSKSFSPSINKKLQIDSLHSGSNKEISTCNDLLKINIGSKKKCLNYNNSKVVNFLLKNLKNSKNLDPNLFIAPKQLMANCWFNTMFVAFFFRDKGRKFFRFFRELMIKGVKTDGKVIEDVIIKKLFFILNLYIEACYNQSNKNSKNTKKNKNNRNKTKKNTKENLYNQIKHLTHNLETNYFIKGLYERIIKIGNYNIPNINDSGNPIMYYKTLINYLEYDILRLTELNIVNDTNIHIFLNKKFYNFYKIPDIIIINDFESKSHYDSNYDLNIKSKIYKYKLDSIIITNKGHFKPKSNSHFVCVCTINKKEYKFDGDSYSRLTRFNWKKLLNINKDWSFLENDKYYPEKYNFTKGYKILLYYRDK